MERIIILISCLGLAFLIQANAATVAWYSASTGVVNVEPRNAELHILNNSADSLWSELPGQRATAINSTPTSDELLSRIINDNVIGGFDPLAHIWKYSNAFSAGDTRLRLKDFRQASLYQLRVKTPTPAAVWLFGSALMGLTCVSRRKINS